MGVLTCIADVVVRIEASDYPSKFSQHYSGCVAGPPQFIKPYGFVMGAYAAESEYACFTSPDLALARTQILDYFHQQKSFLEDDHTIFRFESSMEMGHGEFHLLEQLCLATGHKCRADEGDAYDTTLVQYLTGEARELLDNFPEIGFFRDVVFYFKAFMAPTSDSFPQVQPWLPQDAALEWESNRNAVMTVRGFGQELKCVAYT
eukprot:COSAG06_NODE_22804_length_712_cov_0.730832_1_plen_203_part_10